MENLGDILKRLATTRALANGDHDRDAYDAEVEERNACEVCAGRGWFTADVPAGHPEFGQVVTCNCQVERLDQERSARLLRYSNLGHLARFTFESLDPEGRAAEPESQRLFRAAFDAAMGYATDVAGWLVTATTCFLQYFSDVLQKESILKSRTCTQKFIHNV